MRRASLFFYIVLGFFLVVVVLSPKISKRAETKEGTSRPRLVVQRGHAHALMGAACSPDGRFIITTGIFKDILSDKGGYPTEFFQWHTGSGRLIRSFEGHSGIVTGMAISPDSRFIISGSFDGTIVLWDARTGAQMKKLSGRRGGMMSFAWAPNRRAVVSGSNDKTARYWDLSTGEAVRTFSGHEDGVCSVAISPDGLMLATGSLDDTARLWDVTTGEVLHRFVGHEGGKVSVVFSPDGKQLLTAGEKGPIRLWDINSGVEIRRFEGQPGEVFSVRFSQDGRQILTVGDQLWAWDVSTGEVLRRIAPEGGNRAVGMDAAYCPGPERVLVAGFDGIPKFYDLTSGKEIRRFAGYSSKVNEILFSQDGRTLLTHLLPNTIEGWDLTNGIRRRRIELGSGEGAGELEDAEFSRDGRHLVTLHQGGAAVVWDVANAKEIRRLELPKGGTRLTSMALSPDGKHVLTGDGPGDLWSLLFGGYESKVRLWDILTGEVVREFMGHRGEVVGLAFSGSGELIATGSADRTVRLWRASDGVEILRLEGIDGYGAIAVSPEGTSVASAGDDGGVRLWDIASRHEVGRFDTHPELKTSSTSSSARRDNDRKDAAVELVRFSPGGNLLSAVGLNNTVRLWDTSRGGGYRMLGVHDAKVPSIAFCPPDGRILATGSEDQTIKLWNSESAEELCTIVSFEDGSWAVVAPDGRFDTNDLEEVKGLHWIMPDDPMRPLPVEILMRDYYEPRLLPRVLAGEQFKPIRPLAELNRVQPRVEIKNIQVVDATSGTVAVEVKVEPASGTFEREGRNVPMKTGVYDLRLFRDGQLVAQLPSPVYEPPGTAVSWEEELRQWRGAHKVVDFETGKKTLPFRGIRLPRRARLKDVEFSAYAFNEDRVKSATARTRFMIPEDVTPRQGRAYVIAVGVNAYETPDWDLRYAAKDAQDFSEVLTSLLEGTKDYTDIVTIPLISDWTKEKNGIRKITINDATKAKFKAVLDLLAGRNQIVAPALRASIPNADKLRTVRPEDLVLVAFSSHGYADQSGVFYLFPYDIGRHTGTKVTSELLPRTISSDELSVWLGDIDAGEMVMVIDACHSAASVEGTGFKPGPMGSRGLGQLAYDKGMRILASTRADDVAWESPLTKQGLLSYALVRNGLVKKQADFDPQDKRILLSEWLNYGVKRVPELYAEVRSGQVKGVEEKGGRLTASRRGIKVDYEAEGEKSVDVQQPSLFDFRRAVLHEPLITRLGD